MRFTWKSYLNGWWMTGLMGKKREAYWFLGYSRAATDKELQFIKTLLEINDADPNSMVWKKHGKWCATTDDR